jgi:type VI secretion system secreted protein Hcp
MAAVDYFLKIDGVEGESQDATHKGEVQLSSWSWGATNTGTMQAGSGGGGGKASMQDFSFSMPVNRATPKLVQKLASGEHIKRAVLTCRKAGKTPQEYLRITFEDIIVSSYSTGGAEGADAIPDEHISLNFAKITFEYREQKADGSLGGAVVASHDMKRNQTT